MSALCRSPKVWVVLAAVAVAMVVWGPGPAAALPVLLVLACPLAMLLMAGGMAGMSRRGHREPAADDEVARLRAEVADLRAARTRSS